MFDQKHMAVFSLYLDDLLNDRLSLPECWCTNYIFIENIFLKIPGTEIIACSFHKLCNNLQVGTVTLSGETTLKGK